MIETFHCMVEQGVCQFEKVCNFNGFHTPVFSKARNFAIYKARFPAEAKFLAGIDFCVSTTL